MVKVKRSDGLPPNFDELPPEVQRVIEEQQYRRQMKQAHGYCPGDPRLTSMDDDAIPISGQFGKRVEEKAVEEDE
jgi:hypothetical protein